MRGREEPEVDSFGSRLYHPLRRRNLSKGTPLRKAEG
jgi:hypothetical protein